MKGCTTGGVDAVCIVAVRIYASIAVEASNPNFNDAASIAISCESTFPPCLDILINSLIALAKDCFNCNCKTGGINGIL